MIGGGRRVAHHHQAPPPAAASNTTTSKKRLVTSDNPSESMLALGGMFEARDSCDQTNSWTRPPKHAELPSIAFMYQIAQRMAAAQYRRAMGRGKYRKLLSG